MTDHILMVEGLAKHFGGLYAVRDASLSVERRSFTALIGPNGAGKTSLFNLVSGFTEPHAGSVRFDGADITALPAHRRARRGLVRTFQITKSLNAMSVLDNVTLAAPDQPGESLRRIVLGPARARKREKEVVERATEVLDQFGLVDHREAYAGTLSGGQRKLLELARAVMCEPQLLLLDEPMAGVNPTLGNILMDHIEVLRSQRGMTILFIEHDMTTVMSRAETVIVMAQGTVIAKGTPTEITNNQEVVDAYLGAPARSR